MTSTHTGSIAQIFGPVVDVRFPSGKLPPIYSALLVRDAQAGIDLTEFVAQDPNRDSLAYLLDRINALSVKQGIHKTELSDKKIEKVIEKDRQGKPDLAQLLRESYPRELTEKSPVDGEVLGAVWANRVLTRNNFRAGEDLNKRLLELQQRAEKFKSLAELGKNDDHYPAPADVRDAMEGIGVDIRQVIDRASKACTSAWETRYLMNRNPELVIAAYYKKIPSNKNKFQTQVP